jgi:Flp pilus assembly protein TadG
VLGLFNRLKALRHSEGGASAVEFAIAAPLFFVMLVPLVDLGLGLTEKMQVSDAAGAGAQYALLNGFNQSKIAQAVTSATGLPGVSASPAPSESCGCPNSSGGGVTAASCGSTCQSTGEAAGTYVTVSAQVVYVPMLSYASLGSSVTLSAQSTVRIQ